RAAGVAHHHAAFAQARFEVRLLRCRPFRDQRAFVARSDLAFRQLAGRLRRMGARNDVAETAAARDDAHQCDCRQRSVNDLAEHRPSLGYLSAGGNRDSLTVTAWPNASSILPLVLSMLSLSRCARMTVF